VVDLRNIVSEVAEAFKVPGDESIVNKVRFVVAGVNNSI